MNDSGPQKPTKGNGASGRKTTSAHAPDGRGRVTLRTLATQLGLSVTTVSRALKKGPEVNLATIEKVESAAKTMGYRPHLGGINLRTGRSHAIGVFLPLDRAGEINNFISSLIEGVSAYLKTVSYKTMVVPILRDDDHLASLKDIVEEQSVDGIILKSTTPQDERVKYLLEIGFPFVTYGRTELFTPHPHFDIDHEAIGASAANILLDAGHHAPVLIAPPANLTYSLQFTRGWRQAFASRRLECAESTILFAALTPNSGQEIVRELFAKNPQATAAFIASEEAALGFLAGLREAGREVYRDFSLITYGGSQLHRFLNPPISAFIYSHFYTGERLAEFLARSIAGESPEKLRQVDQAEFIDLRSQFLERKKAPLVKLRGRRKGG
jgi:LacI family transcriptional regulator